MRNGIKDYFEMSGIAISLGKIIKLKKKYANKELLIQIDPNISVEFSKHFTTCYIKINDICMTTSEFNLLEQSDSKTGLSVRCIEIPAPFTTSADNSNRIKQCIEENYAVAVEPFIRELFSLDKESVISTYKECYDELFSLHKKAVRCGSVLDERVIQTLAPIYLTAQICKEMEKGIRIRISPSDCRI